VERALRYDERPIDNTLRHTAELPDTPTRDRNIPATAWVEAPAALLALGDDLGHTDPQFQVAMYKRRIGSWLLWRAGPAAEADARYLAVDSKDLTRHFSFRLHPDGAGEGQGPSGAVLHRFREWKQDLLASS
jgi:hypothetical protein